MISHKIKICGLIFFGVLVFIAPFVYFKNYSIYGNRLENISINNHKIKAEVVESNKKIAKGLSNREKMCGNCGMLFKFLQKEKYPFWMKGMKFNLDMVWIDGENIMYIAKNVPYNFQDTIIPNAPADKVLEINAGMADRYGIKIGDSIELD
ncbi:MAG: DUF192 domain-containing protein [Patescibacteria group bacterium]